MSLNRAVRYGLSGVVVALVLCLAAPASAQEPSDPNPGNITVAGGIDFLNTYMFRGIRQDDSGLITWPYADLGLAVYSGDGSVKSVDPNSDPDGKKDGAYFQYWDSKLKRPVVNEGPDGLQRLGFRTQLPAAGLWHFSAVPGGYQSLPFARMLLRKAGILVKPGIDFGDAGEGGFAISLATPRDTLLRALGRLEELAPRTVRLRRQLARARRASAR